MVFYPSPSLFLTHLPPKGGPVSGHSDRKAILWSQRKVRGGAQGVRGLECVGSREEAAAEPCSGRREQHRYLGQVLSSSSPWFFGNLFLLPGGSRFGRPEKIHLRLRQAGAAGLEGDRGQAWGQGSPEERKDPQAPSGVWPPCPSESQFPGPWFWQPPAHVGCRILSHPGDVVAPPEGG